MADSFPGFLFDVEKWFGSVATQRMSFAEKGVYLVMLFQQWRDRSRTVPDDIEAVADLIAINDCQRAEIAAAWDVVRKKFVVDRRTPQGRMFNSALERTRRKQRASWLKKVKAGQRGGNASARNRMTDNEEVEQQCLSSAQRSSTDMNRSDLNRSDLRKNPPTPLAGGRVTRNERRDAERILKLQFGRCPHEPRCGSHQACVVATVMGLRARVAS